jgi:hypothetical protein
VFEEEALKGETEQVHVKQEKIWHAITHEIIADLRKTAGNKYTFNGVPSWIGKRLLEMPMQELPFAVRDIAYLAYIIHHENDSPEAANMLLTVAEVIAATRRASLTSPSCFISYSSKDTKLAERLYGDLKTNGVLCWFAPQDLAWGSKTWDSIDKAIQMREKVLLLLSRNSINSGWVEDEVSKAYAEERRRNRLVLFPVRLDDAIMETDRPWAVKLRDQRNIGDFRRWRTASHYRKNLEALLGWLKGGGGDVGD